MAHEAHHHEETADAGPRVLRVSDRNPGVRTVVLEREPLGKEVTFLPAIVEGLKVTTRHFFANLFGRKLTPTVEYPEEKMPLAPRHRGVHRLMHREDGSVRCVACMMCPTVCPAHCITIVPGEREDPNEKMPVVFEIDELRCVVCGLCVEACPCDAIRMDTGVAMAPVVTRGAAVLAKVDLLARGDSSTAHQGGRGPGWREEEPAERVPESKVPAAAR